MRYVVILLILLMFCSVVQAADCAKCTNEITVQDVVEDNVTTGSDIDCYCSAQRSEILFHKACVVPYLKVKACPLCCCRLGVHRRKMMRGIQAGSFECYAALIKRGVPIHVSSYSDYNISPIDLACRLFRAAEKAGNKKMSANYYALYISMATN